MNSSPPLPSSRRIRCSAALHFSLPTSAVSSPQLPPIDHLRSSFPDMDQEESRAKANEARERRLKQKRSDIYELEMEKLHIWTNSLGKDCNHNIYWFFQRDGRIFVESADHNQWGFYSAKEELDALVSSLNPKGERELALKRHLEKYYTKICHNVCTMMTKYERRLTSFAMQPDYMANTRL